MELQIKAQTANNSLKLIREEISHTASCQDWIGPELSDNFKEEEATIGQENSAKSGQERLNRLDEIEQQLKAESQAYLTSAYRLIKHKVKLPNKLNTALESKLRNIG